MSALLKPITGFHTAEAMSKRPAMQQAADMQREASTYATASRRIPSLSLSPPRPADATPGAGLAASYYSTSQPLYCKPGQGSPQLPPSPQPPQGLPVSMPMYMHSVSPLMSGVPAAPYVTHPQQGPQPWRPSHAFKPPLAGAAAGAAGAAGVAATGASPMAASHLPQPQQQGSMLQSAAGMVSGVANMVGGGPQQQLQMSAGRPYGNTYIVTPSQSEDDGYAYGSQGRTDNGDGYTGGRTNGYDTQEYYAQDTSSTSYYAQDYSSQDYNAQNSTTAWNNGADYSQGGDGGYYYVDSSQQQYTSETYQTADGGYAQVDTQTETQTYETQDGQEAVYETDYSSTTVVDDGGDGDGGGCETFGDFDF